MNFDFTKQPDETEYQYKYRVYQAKWSGLLDDMTWQDIADRLNANLRPDDPEFSESVYRKEATIVRGWFENMAPDTGNIKDLLYKVQKEKMQLRDERTAFNKSLRSEARHEQKLDYLGEVLAAQGLSRYPWDDNRLAHTYCPNDLVILLSDWHIGACYHNAYGQYDSDIAEKRVKALLNTIRDLASTWKDAYIVLCGDMLSGNIHRPIAVTNRENVIDQIKLASELVTEFTYQICKDFDNVYLYSVSGNHSRLAPKEEAMKDERLDDLIPFIVSNTLAHVQNLQVVPSDETSLTTFTVKNRRFVAVHGDYDAMRPQGISNLSLMLGYIPDVVLTGHKHTPAYEEISGVKVVRGGCLGGSGDDFTVAHRMKCAPSQTLLTIDAHGIQAMYPVDLS